MPLKVKNLTSEIISYEKLEEVTSPLILRGEQIDPDGIFSERIFGEMGSVSRRKRFAYINLHTYIVHPLVLEIFIKRLDRKIYNMIIGSKTYSYDEKKKTLIEDESGDLYGIDGFIKLFRDYKYKFDSYNSDSRANLIKAFYRLGNSMFLDKIYVLPAGLRELVLDKDTKKPKFLDPINDQYIKIINLSLKLKNQGHDSNIGKILTINMQKLVNEYFALVSGKLSKKTGAIRANALGKRVDFSGRNVISGDKEIPPHVIGIPVYMIVELFLPHFLHVMLNKKIPDHLYDKIQNYIIPKYGNEINSESLKAYASAIKKFYISDKEELQTIADLFNEYITKDKVVLFKRDPAVHRQSIQGHYIKVHIGHTIKINPTIVGGYGADFDGDSVDCDVKLRVKNIKYGNQFTIHSNILDLRKF